MHCFQIIERVMVGLPILWKDDAVPYISQPKGCIGELRLDDALATGISKHSPDDLPMRLARASIDVGSDFLMFRKPIRRHERLAMVHITTCGGEGGKVYLTANSYDVEMRRDKVERVYRRFPDAGVNPLCKPETLEEIAGGVEELDVLAMLHPGASFRIYRDGKLEGASPQMFVHWNGSELRSTLPRRYEERAAGGFFGSAPALA